MGKVATPLLITVHKGEGAAHEVKVESGELKDLYTRLCRERSRSRHIRSGTSGVFPQIHRPTTTD